MQSLTDERQIKINNDQHIFSIFFIKQEEEAMTQDLFGNFEKITTE